MSIIIRTPPYSHPTAKYLAPLVNAKKDVTDFSGGGPYKRGPKLRLPLAGALQPPNSSRSP